MKDEQTKTIEDFDDILSYVGGWGRFQYMLTIVNFLFSIFLGYVQLSPILVLGPGAGGRQHQPGTEEGDLHTSG